MPKKPTNNANTTIDAIDSFFASQGDEIDEIQRADHDVGDVPDISIEQAEREAIQTEASGDFELNEQGQLTEKPLAIAAEKLDEFPVQYLPEIVGKYAVELATSLEVPVDLPAVLMLAALAVPMAGRYSVEVWPGWVEPLNLYVCVASDPGTLKTPCLRAAFGPLWQFESIKRDQWRAEKERIEEDNAKLSKGEKRKPIPPVPTMFVDDITAETLASKMGQHNERMAIVSDEGTIFKHMTGAYSSNPNNTIWLKSHDGSRLSVDRRDESKHVTLKRPLLTLGMAVQPEALRSVAARPELRGVGMLARFLFAMPESSVASMTFRSTPVPAQIKNAYTALLLTMAKEGFDLNPDGEPSKIEFSPEASEIMREVSCAIAQKCGIGEELHHVADWASKLRGKLARISGLFHCVEQIAIGLDPCRSAVSPDTVFKACSLAPYFISHAKRAFSVMESTATSKLADQIVGYMRLHNVQRCTARMLQRSVFRNMSQLVSNSSQLKTALIELVSCGILKPVAVRDKLRGPKITWYELADLRPITESASRPRDKSRQV